MKDKILLNSTTDPSATSDNDKAKGKESKYHVKRFHSKSSEKMFLITRNDTHLTRPIMK